MSRVAARPPAQKAAKAKRDPAHMARVAELPCVICAEYGMPQLSPTQVHHCIHGRYSARRAPDCMTIPLCEGCHQGMFDTSKVAIHRAPSKWRRLYGPDTDWIGWVEARLAERPTGPARAGLAPPLFHPRPRD